MSTSDDRASKNELPTIMSADELMEDFEDCPSSAILTFLEKFKGFYVTDLARQRHLAMAVKLLENLRDEDGDGVYWIIDYAPFVDGDGCDCGCDYDPEMMKEPIFERLLQLGLNPDLVDLQPYRQSHYATYFGRVRAAELLSACRADLPMKGSPRPMPEEFALHYASQAKTVEEMKQFTEVAAIWRKLATNGFASVAELAHDEKWWAVQNLARRGIVTDREAREDYRGKTAIEWAHFHGKNDIEEELAYLLQVRPQETPATDELKEVVVTGMMKLREENDELKAKVTSLEAELLQHEKKLQDYEENSKKRQDDLQTQLKALCDQVAGFTCSVERKRG